MKNIESIQFFAKKLIKVDSSASIKEVYTLMLSEEISYLPIIDNGGKRNVGVYKRKKLFDWLIKNPGKQIDNVPRKQLKYDAFPEVEMQTSLKDTMRLLHNNSAILVKNNGEYTHLITPRVVANALEEYSVRFMIYESLEKAIRKKIIENNIKLQELNSPSLNKQLPDDSEKLEFGQYITVFSTKWNEMGLEHLDKKMIIGFLNNALQYRNALMHFRLNGENQGLEDAKKLLKFLE